MNQGFNKNELNDVIIIIAEVLNSPFHVLKLAQTCKQWWQSIINNNELWLHLSLTHSCWNSHLNEMECRKTSVVNSKHWYQYFIDRANLEHDLNSNSGEEINSYNVKIMRHLIDRYESTSNSEYLEKLMNQVENEMNRPKDFSAIQEWLSIFKEADYNTYEMAQNIIPKTYIVRRIIEKPRKGREIINSEAIIFLPDGEQVKLDFSFEETINLYKYNADMFYSEKNSELLLWTKPMEYQRWHGDIDTDELEDDKIRRTLMEIEGYTGIRASTNRQMDKEAVKWLRNALQCNHNDHTKSISKANLVHLFFVLLGNHGGVAAMN